MHNVALQPVTHTVSEDHNEAAILIELPKTWGVKQTPVAVKALMSIAGSITRCDMALAAASRVSRDL